MAPTVAGEFPQCGVPGGFLPSAAPWIWPFCPLVLGLFSDITDLSPGWKSVQLEEANSPSVDGHHHYHQANDVDSQASFHLQDTNWHTVVTSQAAAQDPGLSLPGAPA